MIAAGGGSPGMSIQGLKDQLNAIDRKLRASHDAQMAAHANVREEHGDQQLLIERRRVEHELRAARSKALEEDSPGLTDGWFWQARGIAINDAGDEVHANGGRDGVFVTFEDDEGHHMERPAEVIAAVIAVAKADAEKVGP